MTKITKFLECLEYGGKFLKQKFSKVYKNICQQKDNFIKFPMLFIFLKNYVYFLSYCIIIGNIYELLERFLSIFASFSPDIQPNINFFT